MSGLINTIFSDKITKLSTYASIGLLILSLFYIIFFYRNLPPLLPLYNQMPWGEDRLGSTIEIFIPPLLMLVAILGNTFFAAFLYERMPLVARALSVTAFLISLLTIIFVFRTIQLVL
jgi:hypothetical protein